MRKLTFLLALAVAVAFCGGCISHNYPAYTPPPKKQYVFDTSKSTYSDKKISVSISAKCNQYTGNLEGFTLTVENKTNDDLNLVWNDSFYLNNGMTDGGFMFNGVVYSKRTELKQDLIILPKTTINIDILPNYKVEYISPSVVGHSVLQGGWLHTDLGTGEHGAYIKFKGRGIDKRVKLLISVS